MTRRPSRRAALAAAAAIPFCLPGAQEGVPRPRRTRLVFGGDVMLGRYVGRLAAERRDPSWPLRDLSDFLRSADAAFVNLESPFSDRDPINKSNMVFRAAPEMIAALEAAGIDVASTANNHARDCGAHGVEFTIDWLERHGIAAAGSGKSAAMAHAGAVIERNGTRFGFLGYTYDQCNGNFKDIDDRVAVMDVEQMRRDVAAILARADVAIVSMHAGVEYSKKPDARQVEFARAAIEAGARVVAGHHPHVAQPWEAYRRSHFLFARQSGLRSVPAA